MIKLNRVITDPARFGKGETVTSQNAITIAKGSDFNITDGIQEVSLGTAINAIFAEIALSGSVSFSDDEPKVILVERKGWMCRIYKTVISTEDPSEFSSLWTALKMFDQMCKCTNFGTSYLKQAWLMAIGIDEHEADRHKNKIHMIDLPAIITMVVDEGLPLEDVLAATK